MNFFGGKYARLPRIVYLYDLLGNMLSGAPNAEIAKKKNNI